MSGLAWSRVLRDDVSMRNGSSSIAPHAAATRKVAAELRKMSKAELRQTFVDAGILDASGKLTEPYAEPPSGLPGST